MAANTLLFRIYRASGAHPQAWNSFRRFGPLPHARFDHHLPPPQAQDRAVLYAAGRIQTCVAEAFQSTRRIDTVRDVPWLAALQFEHVHQQFDQINQRLVQMSGAVAAIRSDLLRLAIALGQRPPAA